MSKKLKENNIKFSIDNFHPSLTDKEVMFKTNKNLPPSFNTLIHVNNYLIKTQ